MFFSPSSYFSIALISFLFGVGLGNILEDIFLGYMSIFFILILLIYISYHLRQIVFCLFLFFISGVLGVFYSTHYHNYIGDNTLIVDRYEGLYNSYTGTVMSVHARDEFYDEYIVEVGHIGQTKIKTKILSILSIPKNFVLEPGQKISYSGTLYLFEDFNGFSYKKYMLSRSIYFSVRGQIVDTISRQRGWRYYLFSYREKLLSQIETIFPKQEAIFLGGILLGARESIPNDLKEDFNNSGLTHFIAVSGFNITLCIIFVTFLFGFLPVYGRIIVVSSSIILFSLFVGLGAPVVRASIMGILGYIFLQSGTSQRNITLLAFTAFCMVFFSPLSLNYDVSLHLSFLAVIGIIYTQDFFKRIFFFVPEFFAIREALVLTLAALSFALPIMIFQFGQVSLLAPFANILVTWTIPIAMLLGALSLILDTLSHTLGTMLGFITWIFLHYDILMVRFFGNIEWALLEFDFGPYKNYFQALYFIVLVYLVSIYQTKKT